jgi:hypothetical protein
MGADAEDEESEERPSLAWLSEGILVSQRILVVAFAMSLPVLLGHGLDVGLAAYRGGAVLPVGLLVGCGFGMLSGGWQLWRLTQWLEQRSRKSGAGRGQSSERP